MEGKGVEVGFRVVKRPLRSPVEAQMHNQQILHSNTINDVMMHDFSGSFFFFFANHTIPPFKNKILFQLQFFFMFTKHLLTGENKVIFISSSSKKLGFSDNNVYGVPAVATSLY